MERNCQECKEILEPKNIDKWRFSFIGAVIVILVFNPFVFSITQNIFGNILYKKCPTLFGYFLHTFVYILLVRLSMGY